MQTIKNICKLLLAGSFVLCGCTTTRVSEPISSERQENDIVDQTFNARLKKNSLLTQNKEKNKEGIEENLVDQDDEENSQLFASYKNRPEVKKWIEFFSKKNKSTFERYLARGSKYESVIKTILKKQGVPTYFYYLAMIESGFTVAAKSRAHATGVWQFMAGTAQRYGLRINEYVDERRDPIRSTIAAAEYLIDLNNVFNSWFLAMAAYNAGEMRIFKAIMGNKSRDYWELSDAKVLPTETREYIPKFMAAAIIAQDPEAYGMNLDETVEEIPALSSVAFPSPIKVEDVAKSANMELSLIQDLNPHLLRGMTPPHIHTYRMWLPDSVSIPEEKLASLQRIQLKPEYHAHRKGNHSVYLVEKGESLRTISKKLGVSVRTLKRINKTKSTKLIAGSKILVPEKQASVSKTKNYSKYKVQPGENLRIVSKKFGVSLRELRRMNSLQGSKLQEGQVLNIGVL